jgi:very-short-patch-repair endonuclease
LPTIELNRFGVMVGHRYQTVDQRAWRKLKVVARQQRKEATPAERNLWEILRHGDFGMRVRRQHVIGQFVADFVFLQSKVIVEVDGEIHETHIERDAERDTKLQGMGFRILRLKNAEAMEIATAVIQEIGRHLRLPSAQAQRGQKDTPSPAGEACPERRRTRDGG